MSKRSTSKSSRRDNQADRTDWCRVDSLRNEDIDTSEHPEMTPAMFARSVAREGLQPMPRKQQVTLRIDTDVLHWFRGQGKGYQSRVNALLRAYMEAHESKRD